ncbi:prominin-1-A-like [Ylistrum balloti]|uniref:prominin-1-A-like n=1 Tax=Ylistrum balloti TaxID=509963 RepID=UPI0029057F1A|nr:prominin-1-A-like [Ylistrum balloti]
MLQGSFDKLEQFAAETVKEIEQAGSNTLDRTVDGVVSRIRDATKSTVDEVKKTINADKLLTDAENLGGDASAVLTDLQSISTTLVIINELNTKITDTLRSVKNAVNDTCISENLPVSCPVPSLDAGTNFAGITSLSDEISNMKGAQGIVNETQTARAQFNQLQEDIYTDINKEIDDAVNRSKAITEQVSGQLNTVNQTVQPFVDSISQNVDPQLQDLDTYLKEYGDYLWYGGIAIPCVVILAVMFYYIGIMFGTFGDRPGVGAQCCNKGAGSNLLVCGVVWSFLFASILMLVVLIMFLVGGGIYGIMCRELNKGVENVQLYEPVVDEVLNIQISKLLYDNNAPANLTLGGILDDCKNNKALYTAVKLKHLFDLDALLNTTEVTAEIDKVMENTLPNIGNISIIPTDLKNKLNEFSNSGVASINFTQYTTQLDKQILTSPLSEAITDLNHAAAATDPTNTAASESLRNQSVILQNLENEEIANMSQQFTLQQVTRNISSYVQLEIDGVKNQIKNNIGKCQPLYAATQTASDAFCLITLDPFNGFWFGLGWGLSAFIFCMVFALCLASLYQREEPYDKLLDMSRKKARQTQQLDSPDMEMYQGQTGYNAYSHQDNVPLTSMEAGYQKGGRSRGVPNAAYDNGQHQDPYLRYGEGGYDYNGSDRPPSYHESGKYPQHPMHGGYPVLPQQQKYY